MSRHLPKRPLKKPGTKHISPFGIFIVKAYQMLSMKKVVLLLVAAAAMIYAACTHYYGVGNHKPERQHTNTVDTAMGGDAMKKDSLIK